MMLQITSAAKNAAKNGYSPNQPLAESRTTTSASARTEATKALVAM